MPSPGLPERPSATSTSTPLGFDLVMSLSSQGDMGQCSFRYSQRPPMAKASDNELFPPPQNSPANKQLGSEAPHQQNSVGLSTPQLPADGAEETRQPDPQLPPSCDGAEEARQPLIPQLPADGAEETRPPIPQLPPSCDGAEVARQPLIPQLPADYWS